MSRTDLMNSTAILSTEPRLIFIVKGDSGGVGGTVVATFVANAHEVVGRPVAIGVLDSQGRIARQLAGLQVHVFDPSLHGHSCLGNDAVVRTVAPLYDHATKSIAAGTSYIIDQAASRSGDTLRIAWEAGLAEDVAEIGGSVALLVVGVATEDSVLQCAKQLELARQAFPGAQLVYVENRLQGSLADLLPETGAARAAKEKLLPALTGVHQVAIPRIRPVTMSAIERAGLSATTVANLRIEELMSRTGLDRLQARLAQAELQGVLLGVIRELGPVLGLPAIAG